MQQTESRRTVLAHIEKNLHVLCGCGFNIASPYSFEDILRVFEKMIDEGDLDEDVYSDVVDQYTLMTTIDVLGEDYEYGKCYCENLWITDFEAVDGYESYMYAIERLVNITQGALELDNLKTWDSEPSAEDSEARIWISFEFQGKKYEFSYEFKKFFDHVGLLIPIIELFETVDPTKVFACDTDGEIYTIFCISKEDLKNLNKRRMQLRPLLQKLNKYS